MVGKPVIAIAPEVKVIDGEEYVSVNREYADRVVDAGGVPFIIPPISHRFSGDESRVSVDMNALLKVADGLVIPGGGDVHPDFYHDNPESSRDVLSDVDKFIIDLIVQAADYKRLPVLGICGGLQRIVIAYGGSLYQDIRASSDGAVMIDHQQKTTPNRPWHDVRVDVNSKLYHMMFNPGDAGMTKTNSFHHQSVNVCPDSFKVVARSEDGVVEAVEYGKDDKPLLVGVQWHPDVYLRRGYEVYEDASSRLFNSFVSLCRDWSCR